MILIAAIDDHGGMMFHHRRQSRDRIMIEKILAVCGDEKIRMSAYSAGLFPSASVIVDDEFLISAGEGELCFAEVPPLFPFEDRIEKIFLFQWNRHYPADLYFDIDLSKWKRIDMEEFAGFSHEKITLETYIK
ncbi:MAG: ribonuclease Z [Clostridiales bacterium]|nr:ribonuclease Z [Clostridiales bacterium]